MFSEVTAEILADRLEHNVRVLRARCRPGTGLCAPLKAGAYGHGIRTVAPVLARAGVDMAAVACLDEAIELRDAGWLRPILVLGHVLATESESERAERIAAILEYDLAITLCDEALLDAIHPVVTARRRRLDVHVKVDTGMGRMGCMPGVAKRIIGAMSGLPGLRLAGLYSHFGTADLSDGALADEQQACFGALVSDLGVGSDRGVLIHMANTAATIERRATHFDMVRPGLGLYGYSPAERLESLIDLRPALRLSSRVTLVKQLPAGHCVGYGCSFRTQRPTRLGLVPVGYHDGYLRALSNRAVVGTAAGDAPVVGRISMDQLAIDLTHLPTVVPGDRVTLMDERPERPNSLCAIARLLGTIPYEVLCLIGPRVERVLRTPTETLPSARYEVAEDENLNKLGGFGRSSPEQAAISRSHSAVVS